MKAIQKKISFLFLIVFVLNFSIIPSLVMGFDANSSSRLTTLDSKDFDGSLTSAITQHDALKTNEVDMSGLSSSSSSKFDKLLMEYINGEMTNLNNEITIIILFDDLVTKNERIRLISELIRHFELIDNYDIIPGVAIKCYPKELIEARYALENNQAITHVSKSRLHSIPVINEQLPSPSNLNDNNFPNWWVPAVGADNLDYDGTGVRVAVIDTGIYTHSDLNVVLRRNLISGENPLDFEDQYGHGTHAAGIVGSSGASSGGIYRGIAPGASLIGAKAGSHEGLEDADIISAIDWSVNTANADILSMSFGGGLPMSSDPMNLALSAATELGVICVSSAGNDGPGYLTGAIPASGVDVISVGATGQFGDLASFSSWGPALSYLGYVDVVAPGVNVISTEAPNSVLSYEKRYIGDYFEYPGENDYIPLSGTSMSCPVVAGALAILKEAYPSLTPETARIALMEGANKLEGNDEDDFLKFGAGLINVSASLDYLSQLNSSGNVNDAAKIFPDELPIKPFDLLNYPYDRQLFNLTVISGNASTYDINVPNEVEGLLLSLDSSQLTFTDPGVNFFGLTVEIEHDAKPGVRTFELNITSGAALYDSVSVSIDVKLPEYRILMESYHGLNDWFPDMSFYQMNFYDAMKEITDLNISIDYLGQYWTPQYDPNTNNSILTEERLSRYDLVILQNPILAYSPMEISNMKNYFNSGGNFLFLGTRYQELCSENINHLFSELEVGISVNEENIISENWLGIGATSNTIPVIDLDATGIFNDVDKFAWDYGNTFTISGNANSEATLDSKTVVASFDGRSSGKGRFIAFGDLHWLMDSYSLTNYKSDHSQLMQNLMDYFLSGNDVSLNIGLKSEHTVNADFNLSFYLKDLTTDEPISSDTLNTYLNVSITNTGYFESIKIVAPEDGIAINTSFSLPSPYYEPYLISANITIGGTVYHQTTKILYFNYSQMPKFNSFLMVPRISTGVERNGNSFDLNAVLDADYYDVDAYFSIYSYSYYNSKKTVNRTRSLVYSTGIYNNDYTPTQQDPAGIVISYLSAFNPISNFSNPFSPRVTSRINNNNPEIDELQSWFTVDGSEQQIFNSTHSEDSTMVYQVSQQSLFEFRVKAQDSVGYEDQDGSNMRVSVNLFICTVLDNYLFLIFPQTLPVWQLSYQAASDTHGGSFTIPFDISYSSLTGSRTISTDTSFNLEDDSGYIAVLFITVFDSEGGSEDFILVLQIERGFTFDWLIIALVVITVALAVVFTVVLLIRKSRKSKRIKAQTAAPGYYTQLEDEGRFIYKRGEDMESTTRLKETEPYSYFCPYCGNNLGAPMEYCPNCGKALHYRNQ